ncbi:MAG: hypothetical protein V3V08_00905 [Nannocystaceae bacterium]
MRALADQGLCITPLLRDGHLQRFFDLASNSANELLPGLPRDVAGIVVKDLLEKGLVEQLDDVVGAVDSYLRAVDRVNAVFDFAGQESSACASSLEAHCEGLCGTASRGGLGIGELSQELVAYRACIDWFDEVSTTAAPVLEVAGGYVRTISDCEGIAETARKLFDGPQDLLLYARPSHALELTRA